MEPLTKILIGVGVSAGALVGFGLYEASKQAAAATPTAPPGVAPGQTTPQQPPSGTPGGTVGGTTGGGGGGTIGPTKPVQTGGGIPVQSGEFTLSGGSQGGASVAAVSAPGPYGSPTTLAKGCVYLFSANIGGQNFRPGMQMNATGVLMTSLFRINQTWAPGSVPANWPAGDTDPTKSRVSATYIGPTMTMPVSSAGLPGGAVVFSTGLCGQ